MFVCVLYSPRKIIRADTFTKRRAKRVEEGWIGRVQVLREGEHRERIKEEVSDGTAAKWRWRLDDQFGRRALVGQFKGKFKSKCEVRSKRSNKRTSHSKRNWGSSRNVDRQLRRTSNAIDKMQKGWKRWSVVIEWSAFDKMRRSSGHSNSSRRRYRRRMASDRNETTIELTKKKFEQLKYVQFGCYRNNESRLRNSTWFTRCWTTLNHSSSSSSSS